MTMDLDAVTTLSRTLVKEHDPRLQVIEVMSRGVGGTDRVELLITIAGCHAAPCVLMLNITRAEPSALADELRSKLTHALQVHDTPP